MDKIGIKNVKNDHGSIAIVKIGMKIVKSDHGGIAMVIFDRKALQNWS